MTQEIVLRDASSLAGALSLQGGEVDSMLPRHPANEGRRAAPGAGLGRGPAVALRLRCASIARPRGVPRDAGVGGGLRLAALRRGRWCKVLRGGRLGCRAKRDGRTVALDVGDDRADLDGFALSYKDLGENARLRRGDLGVDLVGRDLEDRLVPVHGLTDLLEPLGDGALGDGLTHLGHRHFGAHGRVRVRGAARPPLRRPVFLPRPGRVPA